MGLTVLGTLYVGYFKVKSFEFSLGSLGEFCRISDVKIFKGLLLPEFSSKFHQTLQIACIREKYRLLLFLGICQIFKVYGTLNMSKISYDLS